MSIYEPLTSLGNKAGATCNMPYSTLEEHNARGSQRAGQ